MLDPWEWNGSLRGGGGGALLARGQPQVRSVVGLGRQLAGGRGFIAGQELRSQSVLLLVHSWSCHPSGRRNSGRLFLRPVHPHEQLIFLRVPLFASLPVAVAGLRLDEALSGVGRKPRGLSLVRRAPADAGAASPVVGGADGRGSSLPVVVSPALLPRAGCGSGGVSARVGVSTG